MWLNPKPNVALEFYSTNSEMTQSYLGPLLVFGLIGPVVKPVSFFRFHHQKSKIHQALWQRMIDKHQFHLHVRNANHRRHFPKNRRSFNEILITKTLNSNRILKRKSINYIRISSMKIPCQVSSTAIKGTQDQDRFFRCTNMIVTSITAIRTIRFARTVWNLFQGCFWPVSRVSAFKMEFSKILDFLRRLKIRSKAPTRY